MRPGVAHWLLCGLPPFALQEDSEFLSQSLADHGGFGLRYLPQRSVLTRHGLHSEVSEVPFHVVRVETRYKQWK